MHCFSSKTDKLAKIHAP